MYTKTQTVKAEEKQLKDFIIVETQEESEQEDEIILTLLVDGKTVSWAKTLLYSYLEEMHTVHKEKRKGYGSKLLAQIEKNAKAHGANKMIIRYDISCSDEAASFFRNLGYCLKPI
jgi:GNAT superfamily N-acetyltransferase